MECAAVTACLQLDKAEHEINSSWELSNFFASQGRAFVVVFQAFVLRRLPRLVPAGSFAGCQAFLSPEEASARRPRTRLLSCLKCSPLALSTTTF